MADDFLMCQGNVTTECTNGDCNKSLITFAFAMVTVDWIIIVFWVSVIGFLLYSHNKRLNNKRYLNMKFMPSKRGY